MRVRVRVRVCNLLIIVLGVGPAAPIELRGSTASTLQVFLTSLLNYTSDTRRKRCGLLALPPWFASVSWFFCAAVRLLISMGATVSLFFCTYNLINFGLYFFDYRLFFPYFFYERIRMYTNLHSPTHTHPPAPPHTHTHTTIMNTGVIRRHFM